MTIVQLERDLEAKREEGRVLLEKTARAAEAGNREFTDDERAALTKITEEGKGLQARIGRARGDESLLMELDRLTAVAKSPTSGGGGFSRRAKTLGEQFVASDAYEFFRKGGHRTQSAWRSPSVELSDSTFPFPHAATLTEDPASGGALVIPQYLPGIQALALPVITVPQLFAQGTAESNLIVFMRETTFTNAAATVREGLVKPESTLIFASANAPVRKIAHWLPVSEEMLEDVAQIRSYIDARLRVGVSQEEEDQLLNGTGTDPDILGILNTPGLSPAVALAAGQSNFDAILKQIMAVYTASFLMPDGIVMNPSDWTYSLLTKTQQGNYLTPGPFSPIQTPTMWGLPVALTPKMVAASALVGAFQTAAQIFRRGGIRVEASNSHADFFIKNLVAIRAEERLALATYRPAAFGKVTGLSPATP